MAAAVARHPARFVGFFMLDPSAPDAPARATRAVAQLGLRGICLFPAMHQVPLDDERVGKSWKWPPRNPGVAVFVHCGVLTVGVRRRLGLPSRFDLRLGDPRAVARLALAFPQVPFIIPHFGAGTLQDVLMAADVCPNSTWTRRAPTAGRDTPQASRYRRSSRPPWLCSVQAGPVRHRLVVFSARVAAGRLRGTEANRRCAGNGRRGRRAHLRGQLRRLVQSAGEAVTGSR